MPPSRGKVGIVRRARRRPTATTTRAWEGEAGRGGARESAGPTTAAGSIMLGERGDRDPSQEEGSIAIATWSLTVLFIGLVFGSAWGQPSPSAADVLEALRGGGYIIVLRHGATHADQADTDPLNLDNVAKQRQLNDTGRADAKMVGEVFKTATIPIGKSYSSRFQRAMETARLIRGKEPQTTLDITEGGLVVSPN